ncbi:NUDIX hydrolase [Gracilibacillus xinjiangensis]|uniref:NUDIX hydrolase n=1 Tax=Gracilibacillus xinjiangensis TaxID=1193282 RepID=A0ABV8WVC6_9BACI
MDRWLGSAGICFNENRELLMVLQGKPDEVKKWSVPSGGVEAGETFAECCIREFWEETGYLVEVEEEIKVKKGCNPKISIAHEVHYFSVKIVGGEMKIHDPDQLIYDIRWKTLDEIKELEFSFHEDRGFLLDFIREKGLWKQKLD